MGERYLLFDYDGGDPAPDLRGLSAEQAAVFVSHRHADHFSEKVLSYPLSNPHLTLILSDDIDASGTFQKVAPHETLQLPGMTVRTLRSTDEGVAFLVKTEEITIYHAGDLNWWHWEEENETWNREMADSYRAEIDILRGEKVDLAFLPVDGRLGRAALWGADYFMKHVGADYLIPMHFWDDCAIFSALKQADYSDSVLLLSHRGESVTIEL